MFTQGTHKNINAKWNSTAKKLNEAPYVAHGLATQLPSAHTCEITKFINLVTQEGFGLTINLKPWKK